MQLRLKAASKHIYFFFFSAGVEIAQVKPAREGGRKDEEGGREGGGRGGGKEKKKS